MAVVRSEFALALNQVASERGIDPDVVLETIRLAIAAAYRKDYGGNVGDYIVEVSRQTGEAKVFKKDNEGNKGQEVTPPGFGRIAAQTAKQVILQKIREAEKNAVIKDYSSKIGTLVNGVILRFDGPNIIVDIGRTEGVMPPSEQVPAEKYRLNQRLVFYLKDIRQSPKGKEIVVSRSAEELVSLLFKREVPEVRNGAVTIKQVARELGSRTKTAVVSNQTGVDPVGSCVGQKGVRVQAVIKELGGEKIDIIEWYQDPSSFIAASLSPAANISVTSDLKKKTALAVVPDDQLSLAIGREGQNVRLATKLTGFKIDIRGKSQIIIKKRTSKIKKTEKTAKSKESKIKEKRVIKDEAKKKRN